MRPVDPAFTALPLAALADAGLSQAGALGASHADIRVRRGRAQDLRLHDAMVEGGGETEDRGVAVRVVVDGTWGFAAGSDLDPAAAGRLASEAVAVARACRPLTTEPIELAPEPVHADGVWVSDYDVNPFDVADSDKLELLTDWSRRLLDADAVDHASAYLDAVQENIYYADLTGTATTQQRVRLDIGLEAFAVGPDGRFDSMRTLGPPVGRGWEAVTGGGWDYETDVDTLPGLLAEKMAAPSVEAGRWDLVVDPSNLWLTIHESVGHATELDRALGYEAAFAGTSFATVDRLGTLRYGSPLMHVTGDRTVRHGLASVGWDDDGVAAQQWDLVREGVLVGYQTDRRIARRAGLERSNGCAYADSHEHIPLQRMANVSLQPAPAGPSTDDLIKGVERGIYVVGDRSWSIDMQRYNFQFTGQRFHLIRSGRLVGQLRDVAYQATTTDFWGSMVAVGGPQTWQLRGAFNCGKGQPGQVAAVSHGCPTAVFEQVNVLNAVDEAGAR